MKSQVRSQKQDQTRAYKHGSTFLLAHKFLRLYTKP